MNNKEIFKEYAGHTATVSDEVILKMMDAARDDEIAKQGKHDLEVHRLQERNKTGHELDERWCPHKKDICRR